MKVVDRSLVAYSHPLISKVTLGPWALSLPNIVFRDYTVQTFHESLNCSVRFPKLPPAGRRTFLGSITQ